MAQTNGHTSVDNVWVIEQLHDSLSLFDFASLVSMTLVSHLLSLSLFSHHFARLHLLRSVVFVDAHECVCDCFSSSFKTLA